MSDGGTTPTRITVPTHSGSYRVRAHIVKAAPGLCVNVAVWGTWRPKHTRWVVTHLATGLAIGKMSWRSKEAAIGIAEALGAVMDWHLFSRAKYEAQEWPIEKAQLRETIAAYEHDHPDAT